MEFYNLIKDVVSNVADDAKNTGDFDLFDQITQLAYCFDDEAKKADAALENTESCLAMALEIIRAFGKRAWASKFIKKKKKKKNTTEQLKDTISDLQRALMILQTIILEQGQESNDEQEQRLVLWVDDNPGNNSVEASTAETKYGIEVVQKVSTEEAKKYLAKHKDLKNAGSGRFRIITDAYREDEGPNAGRNLIEWLRNEEWEVPVLMYCGEALNYLDLQSSLSNVLVATMQSQLWMYFASMSETKKDHSNPELKLKHMPEESAQSRLASESESEKPKAKAKGKAKGAKQNAKPKPPPVAEPERAPVEDDERTDEPEEAPIEEAPVEAESVAEPVAEPAHAESVVLSSEIETPLMCGIKSEVKLQVLDQYGNAWLEACDFSAHIDGPEPDFAEQTNEMSFIYSVKAIGRYTLSASLGDNSFLLGNFDAVAGHPEQIIAQSIESTPGIIGVSVHLTDKFGQACSGVTLKSTSHDVQVIDQGDGSYTINVELTEAGVHQVHLSALGVETFLSITVSSGSVSAQHSIVELVQSGCVGEVLRCSIQLRDSWDNPVNQRPEVIVQGPYEVPALLEELDEELQAQYELELDSAWVASFFPIATGNYAVKVQCDDVTLTCDVRVPAKRRNVEENVKEQKQAEKNSAKRQMIRHENSEYSEQQVAKPLLEQADELRNRAEAKLNVGKQDSFDPDRTVEFSDVHNNAAPNVQPHDEQMNDHDITVDDLLNESHNSDYATRARRAEVEADTVPDADANANQVNTANAANTIEDEIEKTNEQAEPVEQAENADDVDVYAQTVAIAVDADATDEDAALADGNGDGDGDAVLPTVPLDDTLPL